MKSILTLLFATLSFAQIPERDVTQLSTAITDCGVKPNCVSSLATSDDKKINSISFSGSLEDYQSVIQNKVAALPRTKIVRSSGPYFHIEFKTALMRFNDDVELYYADHQIYVRSSSRIGYSDLGANRKRVEELRQLLQTL